MTHPKTDNLRDHFRGALLGTMCGDSLGLALEGLDLLQIATKYGGMLRELEAGHQRGSGTYTDDTQLAFALAESLLDTEGVFDPDEAALVFGEHFEPHRGYGGNTYRILNDMAGGRPWAQAVGAHGIRGGSYGNGSAMRVAPVALASFGNVRQLLTDAGRQGVITGHTHADAVAGSRLQALAVHEAIVRGSSGQPLVESGGASRPEGSFIGVLRANLGDLPPVFDEALSWIADNLDAPMAAAASKLGTGVYVGQSVPTALWAVLASSSVPGAELPIVRAANLGGDADTIGAMAGAIAGAYWGASTLPDRWLAKLENGERGRDYAVNLADELLDLVEV